MSGVEDASARPDMGVERGSDASDRGRMDGDLPFSQCGHIDERAARYARASRRTAAFMPLVRSPLSRMSLARPDMQ